MELLGNYKRSELRKSLEAHAVSIEQAISKILVSLPGIKEQFDISCVIENSFVGNIEDDGNLIYENPDFVHIKFRLFSIPYDLQNYFKRLANFFVLVEFDCYHDTNFDLTILLSSCDLIREIEDYYKSHQVL